MSSYEGYETVQVTSPHEHVLVVNMNRPRKRNAMNMKFWEEMRELFAQIAQDGDVRVVLLSGEGKLFTAGLDISDPAVLSLGAADEEDVGRKALKLRQKVLEMQESFTVIERCAKPVIACVHSGCVGGGIDMITACDVRLCSSDAWFSVKEVDLGLAADVGTLQRLPKVAGNDSLVREVCYTARRFTAAEAKEMGLVSRVVEGSRSEVITAGMELAKHIATRSPIAIAGTKVNLNYARDHTVREGLEYIATWNAAMLQSSDIPLSAQATFTRQAVQYARL